VTPHIAGDGPGATRRAFELAGAQVRRFAAGEPLVNVVARYLLE
jgi:phosphoglycerate dehydrogenase-like enzyme